MKSTIFVSAIFIGIISLVLSNSYTPIIAIVSLPDPPNQVIIQTTNVMGHYVRWIESAGGQTIAIHSWMSDEELDTIFTKINGVFFQGGGRDLYLDGEFEVFSTKIVKKVIELKRTKGIHIPLWGTCQGFELINMIFAGTHDVLTYFDADNVESPLIFNKSVLYESKMFSFFTKEDIENLSNRNTTAHYHNLGTNQATFDKYKLNDYFKVTSYGVGRDKENISIESYEAKDFPIYAVQFHPEKVTFDHYEERVNPMSPEAVKVSINLALFFISEARKNTNNFTEDDRKKYDFIDIYSAKWTYNSGHNKVTYYTRPSRNLKYLK